MTNFRRQRLSVREKILCHAPKKFPKEWERQTMKTRFHTFLLLSAALVSISTGSAETIKSTYIGPIGGNWNGAANWSPAIVPNNTAKQKFDVSIPGAEFPGVTLDIDVKLRRLTLEDNFSTIFLQDHNLTSARTSVGVNFPDEIFTGGVISIAAADTAALANLGHLVDFSGTTLNSGFYLAFAAADNPAAAATIQFNGADIQTNSGSVQLWGARSRIVDEQGRDALRHFQHNLVDGDLYLAIGHNLTTGAPVVNEGEIDIFAKDSANMSGDITTTLTINGNYTGIGFPLDPDTLGLVSLLAPGPIGDARMVIKGALTNYDANTKTLGKTRYEWQAANGARAITKVLGGERPLDIVTSEASFVLFGPHTGFRDKYGKDALRNLAVNGRMLIGDRQFSTAGDFTSTSRLSIFGDTLFTVNGNLTIQGGFMGLWALTGYALAGDPDFPIDPAYLPAHLLVTGSFNLPAQSILRFHVFDPNTLATMSVNGTATLAGALQSGVDDVSQLTPSDSITVMTANHIVGQFSNVASGGRINSYIGFDADNNPIGDPLGSFLVTYDNTELVLSDFQPAENAARQKRVRVSSGRLTLDGEE